MNQLAKIEDPISLQPKMTLAEILRVMRAADEGLADLSLDEMRELAKKAEIKVDGYHHLINKLEARASELDNEARPLLKASTELKSKADGLKKILLFHMNEHGLTKMPGERFKVAVRTSKSVAIKPGLAPGVDIAHADFTRVTWAWDKIKISAALKVKDPVAMDIAEFEENQSVNFSVSKGDLDETV